METQTQPLGQEEAKVTDAILAVNTPKPIIWEAMILDEVEPVKLTASLIREKSKVLTDLTIKNILDDAGYKAVKNAANKAVKTRTAIEAIEKSVLKEMKTRHATEIKQVTDYTAELYIACREAEKDLKDKVTKIDNEKLAEQQRLEKIEKDRTDGRENKMYQLGLAWNGSAFVGLLKQISKEYLFGLSDEGYNDLITELEGAQMEQSIAGEEKPTEGLLMPKGVFRGAASANIPQMGFQHQPSDHATENAIYDKAGIDTRPELTYPNTVHECVVAEAGIKIILTKGKIEVPEPDALVVNERVADSGVYLQVIR